MNPWLVAGVAIFRVLLAFLCAETGWRYWRWWKLVYDDSETRLLRDLMIGISLVQIGLMIFSTYALLYGSIPRSGKALGVLFVGDAFVVLGTFLHLRPAWRLSRVLHDQVKLNILARVVVAMIIGGILLLLDLQ